MITNFGSSLGVAIEFECARISSLLMGSAIRRIDLTEGFDSDEPFYPPERVSHTLEALNDKFEGGLAETTMVRQILAGCSRTITISNKLSTGKEKGAISGPRAISAEIELDFECPRPLVWTIQLGETADSADTGPLELSIGLSKATTVIVRASAGKIRLAKETPENLHTTWSFDFPSGRTKVTLLLDVGSWANVADTAVICRPSQIREAAIALASVPDRRFVPLVVLEPPPMSGVEVSKIFREIKDQVDESLGLAGAFGSADFERWSRVDKLKWTSAWNDHLALQQQMHPYRSWTKRNRMLRKSLLDFGVKQAICLFEPTPDDLTLTDIEYDTLDMPLDAIDVSEFEGLLDGLNRVVLRSCNHIIPTDCETSRLGRVYEECRRVVGEPASADAVEISDGDPAAVILGLYEARRAGRPLRFTRDSVVVATGSKPRSAGAVSDNHVVAVEARDQADVLIAPLFAAHLRTKLIITTAPDLGSTQRIIRELQAAVVEYARRSTANLEGCAPDPSIDLPPSETSAKTADALVRYPNIPKRIRDLIRKYVYGDRRFELLGQLENEVSRQVSAAFIKAVGTSDLTVFGSGLPYHFVKTGSIDWSNKLIGHVIADADLIVINELHNEGAIDPVVSFNLIIDPGFFRHSETDAVAEALKARPALSLILREDSQIAQLFLRLATTAPLDFVFFNTHGDDNSILIDNYPLENYKISQWLEFEQRPLIFNNSCMSWTGVGRDFVRVGARGYVGTLWSVRADAAADLARLAMTRMIDRGEPICGAIRQPTVDPFTSSAYIFVGTARATFRRNDGKALADDSFRLIAVLQSYVRILRAVQSAVVGGQADAFTIQLYAEFKALRDALIARGEAHLQPVMIDAMLAELKIIEHKSDAFNIDLKYRLALAERCREMLAGASLNEASRDRRMADVLYQLSSIYLLMGHYETADAVAKVSIVISERGGQKGNEARQVRIQAAIDENRLDDAFVLAEAFLKIVEEKDDDFEMATLGRLCQILKRMPARRTDSLKFAQRGFDLAVSKKNLREEATFALDLAQIHLMSGEADKALLAAQRALAASRRASSALGELAAYGTMGQCYLILKDAANARVHAELGLARARNLHEPQRATAFLADLARTEEMDGNGQAALAYWIEAIGTAASLPRLDLWQASFRMGLRVSLHSRDSDGCARLIANAIASLSTISAKNLEQAGSWLFSILPGLFVTWPCEQHTSLCRLTMQRSDATIAAIGSAEGPSFYGRLLFATCAVVGLIESGLGERAIQEAEQIDAAFGADGSFVDFVGQATQDRH